jgi:NitT/TauT family transport system substrate-binding protein
MRRLSLVLLLCLTAGCASGTAAPPQSPSAASGGPLSPSAAGASGAAQPPGGAASTAGAVISPQATGGVATGAATGGAGAAPAPSAANPYLATPGQPPIDVKAATCAVSGGFVHLYTAVDAGLFQKYGLNVEHVSIAGSAPSLAALSAGEIQFLYCAAEASIAGLASGADARLVAAPLLGLPYVLVARPDIHSVPELRGRVMAMSRAGQLNDRLVRMVAEKFGLRPNEDVEIRPTGGGQPEQLQAVLTGIADATAITAPLDAYARKQGMNIIYDINAIGLPFIYSAVHATNGLIRDNPQLVQRFTAAMAEAVYYTEKNPEAARASLRRVLDLDDADALDSAYQAYAIKHVNRRVTIPLAAVQGGIDYAREQGTQVVKGAQDIATNQFADDLDRTGFLAQLWGAELPPK